MPEHTSNMLHFHYVGMAWAISTCSYARLLGPCFKTGRSQSLYIVNTSAASIPFMEAGINCSIAHILNRRAIGRRYVPHHHKTVLSQAAVTMSPNPSKPLQVTSFRVTGHVWILTISRSRRPSGLRKTRRESNSLAHRTTWLRSDFGVTFLTTTRLC